MSSGCQNCGSTDLPSPESAYCERCWLAMEHENPDEWDSVLASATTGASEDYSYLDDEGVPCPFCEHDRHDGAYCKSRVFCDDHDHPCACSYPDPANYAEVPA